MLETLHTSTRGPDAALKKKFGLGPNDSYFDAVGDYIKSYWDSKEAIKDAEDQQTEEGRKKRRPQ